MSFLAKEGTVVITKEKVERVIRESDGWPICFVPKDGRKNPIYVVRENIMQVTADAVVFKDNRPPLLLVDFEGVVVSEDV